jgi:sulfatase maturation enzyme AslB (radical SAM superfamily)
LHKKPELENIIHNQTKPTFFHSIEADGMGGNYCNLSCSMCHEYSSSGVLKEKIELNEPVTIPIKIVNGKQSPLIKVTPCEAFLKELPQLLDNVLELKLVGGEPLMNKESYELMRMVNKPSETNLRIITNGTIDPSKFIQIAKQFESVVVNISIEGVGPVNDYIRYPSDWNTILQTYLKLRKETNFSVSFVTTINALNINRLPEISLKFPKKTYYFASYVDNNCYTLSSIPPDIKQLFLKQLTANKHLDQVDILISYLQNAVYKETDMIEMIQHIKRRDKLRGTNLLDVFPEWKEYYERY